MPTSKRRAAHRRRSLHDDEARSLEMLHEPLGDDARHDLAAVANLLSAAVAQGVRSGSGNPWTVEDQNRFSSLSRKVPTMIEIVSALPAVSFITRA